MQPEPAMGEILGGTVAVAFLAWLIRKMGLRSLPGSIVAGVVVACVLVVLTGNPQMAVGYVLSGLLVGLITAARRAFKKPTEGTASERTAGHYAPVRERAVPIRTSVEVIDAEFSVTPTPAASMAWQETPALASGGVAAVPTEPSSSSTRGEELTRPLIVTILALCAFAVVVVMLDSGSTAPSHVAPSTPSGAGSFTSPESTSNPMRFVPYGWTQASRCLPNKTCYRDETRRTRAGGMANLSIEAIQGTIDLNRPGSWDEFLGGLSSQRVSGMKVQRDRRGQCRGGEMCGEVFATQPVQGHLMYQFFYVVAERQQTLLLVYTFPADLYKAPQAIEGVETYSGFHAL